MNILFYTIANQNSGLGHWYRIHALAQAAEEKWHKVTLASDVLSIRHKCDFAKTENDLADIVKKDKPDWLVFDLPEPPNELIYDLGVRTCSIGGLGHTGTKKADLIIGQGLDGAEYKAPEYLIVRQEALQQRWRPVDRWFVFGGAADKMGIVNRFATSFPNTPAMLVVTEHTIDKPSGVKLIEPKDEEIFGLMSRSKYACIAFGMTAWELVCVGNMMIFVFSATKKHLKDAKLMEQAGYLRAWDTVGLPTPREMREFLNDEFIPRGKKPDGKGAERIIELLEKS